MKAILLGGAAALAVGTGAADAEARSGESEDLSREAKLSGTRQDEGREPWLRNGDIAWADAGPQWPNALAGMIDLSGGRIRQGAAWRFQARMADGPALQPALEPEARGLDRARRQKVVALRFASMGDFGRLRFSYRSGYAARAGGDMAAMLGCRSSSFETAVAGPASPACLPTAAMAGGDAAFHQRRFEKAWHGRGEVNRDLGDAGTLSFGADYRKTRRMFDEAGAFRPRLGIATMAGSDAWAPAPARAIMPNDISSTLGGDLLGDFRMKQKVFAARSAAELRFGSLTVTPAIAYEHTQLRMTGFHLGEIDPGGVDAGVFSAEPLGRRRSFGDLLPSLSLSLGAAPGIVLRSAWHRRVTRPEIIELSPGGVLDRRAQRLSLGNPDLAPARGDAFDVQGEWTYATGASLGMGLFARFERDPVYVGMMQASGDVTLDGVRYDALTVLQPANARRSRIAGIEARWGQQLGFLPGALSDLAVQVTARCTDAWLRLQDGTRTRFPYESRFTVGTRLAWRHGRFGAAMDWLAGSPAPLTVATAADGAASGTRGKAALRRLDMSTSFAVTPRFNLFLEGRNLTDEPVRLYAGSMREWTVPNDRYGRTVYAGMQAKF